VKQSNRLQWELTISLKSARKGKGGLDDLDDSVWQRSSCGVVSSHGGVSAYIGRDNGSGRDVSRMVIGCNGGAGFRMWK